MKPTWMTSLIGYPQTYTASDTGGIIPNPPNYVPSQYPVYTSNTPIIQAPPPQNPALSVQPTGRLVCIHYRDPKTAEDIALYVDEAFYPILLSINQQQQMTSYSPACGNARRSNADFSLEEITEAEKMIEEMKREVPCV